MKILNISWKNLFAFSEKEHTIDYNKPELILLKGRSGTGKSSIMRLPTLLMFGKIDKISKNSIANRINHNGWMKGTVVNNGHTYEIERGFSPNFLNVFKDGVDISNYGIKDAQDYIEQEIVSVPEKVFNNMLVISMRTFKSFLSMSPVDKRAIIDTLFNLTIIQNAFDNVKIEMKEIGNSINQNNASLRAFHEQLRSSILKYKELADEMAKDMPEHSKDENINVINKLNECIETYSIETKGYYDNIEDIGHKIMEINNEMSKLAIETKEIKNKMDLFDSGQCPVCGATFDTDSHRELRQQLQTDYEGMISKIITLKGAANKEVEERGKMQQAYAEMNNKINFLSQEIHEREKENILIDSRNQNTQLEGIKQLIIEAKNKANVITAQLDEMNSKMDVLENLQKLFAPDGAKAVIVSKYINVINKEINVILKKLNFRYTLEFDGNFDAKIYDLTDEIQVASLSDGEQTRVDLAVICSLLKALKLKYNDVNILHFDETLSTLDTTTSAFLLKYLKELSSELDLTIAIVTHTDVSLESFDKVIDVVRPRMFSEIQINEL